VGQDGGLKAFSFVILPHAVSAKPRYLEEEGGERGALAESMKG
jgi:hypothetical protein